MDLVEQNGLTHICKIFSSVPRRKVPRGTFTVPEENEVIR